MDDWEALVQQRSARLFHFLRRLSQLRSSPSRSVDQYDKSIWLGSVPVATGCFSSLNQPEHERSELWLEVEMPVSKPVPQLPVDLQYNVDFEKLSLSSCTLPQLDDVWLPAMESTDLAAAAALQESLRPAFNDYLLHQWFHWAEQDKKNQDIRPLCEALQEIYLTLQTNPETYELLIGLGLFSRQLASGELVQRHILTLRATLNFDSGSRQFQLRASEDAVWEIDEDITTVFELPPNFVSEGLKEKLSSFAEIIWDSVKIEDFFSTWLATLSSRGVYDSSFLPPAPGRKELSHPTIQLAPALFLRRRSDHGFIRFCDQIIDQLESGQKAPVGLERFVNVIDDRAYAPETSAVAANRIYFPLAANPEQAAIADNLTRRQAVLVQGPPGTGKSQTIANLICHLLAQGKRVLVTSHTARALRVLRDKLPDEVKPLCIAVVGEGNAEMRTTLESSISAIQSRHATWSEPEYTRRIDALEQALVNSQLEQQKLDQVLMQSRKMDVLSYTDKFGYFGTAEDIASTLFAERDCYSWFEDRPAIEQVPPLTNDECLRLLHLLKRFPPEKDGKFTFLISKSALPSPDDYARNLVRFEQLQERLATVASAHKEHASYNASVNLSTKVREQIAGHINEVLMIVSPLLNRKETWVGTCVKEVLTDHDRVWRELLELTTGALAKLQPSYRELGTVKVTGLEQRDLHTVMVQAQDLLKHLSSGKSLGFGPFRARAVKEAAYLITDVRVNGKLCETADALKTLISYLEFRIDFDDLCKHWSAVDTLNSDNVLSAIPKLQDYCEPLMISLDLNEKIRELKVTLRACHLIEPDWSSTRDLMLFRDVLLCARIEEECKLLEDGRNKLEALLEGGTARPDAHPVLLELLEAVNARDPRRYAETMEKLEAAENEGACRTERTGLMLRCHAALAETPRWLETVRSSIDDPRWTERLRMFVGAWNHARAERWIRHLYVIDTDHAVLEQLSDIQRRQSRYLAELSAERGWFHFLGRLDERHRQSLDAWKKAVARIGKGTGKHAERHRRAAREHMLNCRAAIPAWIMPMHMLLQTIEPAPESFDVVIVDEASQSGLEAMVLAYIGKQLVVVGDDKQISPDFIGLSRDEVEALRVEHLRDIPFADAIGIDHSFFDLAQIRYSGKIRLREHFRCMPEIIEFSNKLCYGDQPLIPLKQYGSARILPVLGSVFVKTTPIASDGKVANYEEAEALIGKMLELSRQPAYKGKSFGVISLLSTSRQAEYIRRRIAEEFDAREIEERRIMCGDPYDFQGDERDIMFLSLVVRPPESGRKIHALSSEKDEKRFNVAMSRAKEQVWLFHSVQSENLSNKCVRYRLIEHFHSANRRPGHEDTTVRIMQESVSRRNRAPEPFASWLAYDVCAALQKKGYKISAGMTLGGCYIDLIVEGAARRLGIQCHHDEWSGEDAFLKQLKLEQALERCQMPFVRIKGSVFYLEPDVCVQKLVIELERLGICTGHLPEPSRIPPPPIHIPR
ncbi:MAG: AAA family ATPase [Candidatus Obscuribacterales bacterium]|nr:AAA family ATPase [Candidatus Obscuribacterales bacterium]